MNECSLKKIKCPKCKKSPTRLVETGTVTTCYDLKDGAFTDRILSPQDYAPFKVDAWCACGYAWRLRGIDGAECFQEYDFALGEKQ